ncbi:putative secreted protein [Candidatus Nanobsidianus stetteri]|uniref:Putative secreted protein n=1 Tax=Nanobsidianus stetteri TaxID=1294122 RepID=R1G9W1_NANST|nr:putative secreted protein [Candidatus Nanobsidianus stetteri]
MTVAIAGLMYAWLSGMFSSLTTSTSQQVIQATQLTSFNVPKMFISNGNIYAIIYNNGNVPINANNMTITAQEFWASNNTYDGITYVCSASSGIITSGQQSTITLSCNPTSLVTNWNSGIYYYLFTFVYNGVSVQATLPPS